MGQLTPPNVLGDIARAAPKQVHVGEGGETTTYAVKPSDHVILATGDDTDDLTITFGRPSEYFGIYSIYVQEIGSGSDDIVIAFEGTGRYSLADVTLTAVADRLTVICDGYSFVSLADVST